MFCKKECKINLKVNGHTSVIKFVWTEKKLEQSLPLEQHQVKGLLDRQTWLWESNTENNMSHCFLESGL